MNNWLKICGNEDQEMQSQLLSKKQSLIDSGELTEDQIKYMKQVDLSITKGELDISDKALEKLRVLCQLWDVDIRPQRIESHRKFVGPIIITAKKLVFPILKSFMKDFVRQQKDFNAGVISLVGEIATSKKGDNEKN